MGIDDDRRLIAAAQSGSILAFEELVCRHQRRAYTLAYRLVGNHADAADILQETLIRVYRSLPSFQGRSAFSTWLYRVVTNIALDRLRQRHRSCVSLEDQWEQGQDSLLHHIPAEEGDPGLAAERAEVSMIVQQALDGLPCEYRAAIVLRDLQGYSYAEIEQQLGCSHTTLKSRLHRARRSLRSRLQANAAFAGLKGDDLPAWNHDGWRQAL